MRRTNIYINPPVAPPLGGYGYGSPFFGGYGWSPFTFFAPGPSVAVGVGGGAQPAAGGRHAVGAAELHGVLLLPRLIQGPRALPRVLT